MGLSDLSEQFYIKNLQKLSNNYLQCLFECRSFVGQITCRCDGLFLVCAGTRAQAALCLSSYSSNCGSRVQTASRACQQRIGPPAPPGWLQVGLSHFQGRVGPTSSPTPDPVLLPCSAQPPRGFPARVHPVRSGRPGGEVAERAALS